MDGILEISKTVYRAFGGDRKSSIPLLKELDIVGSVAHPMTFLETLESLDSEKIARSISITTKEKLLIPELVYYLSLFYCGKVDYGDDNVNLFGKTRHTPIGHIIILTGKKYGMKDNISNFKSERNIIYITDKYTPKYLKEIGYIPFLMRSHYVHY